MSQQQCPAYLRQEGEYCDAYSDRFLAWHSQSYPVHVGPCRYTRATKPFRAEDVFTRVVSRFHTPPLAGIGIGMALFGRYFGIGIGITVHVIFAYLMRR